MLDRLCLSPVQITRCSSNLQKSNGRIQTFLTGQIGVFSRFSLMLTCLAIQNGQRRQVWDYLLKKILPKCQYQSPFDTGRKEKKNQWKPIYIYCKYRILRQKDVTYFYMFTWVMHYKHCKGESLGENRTTHKENSSLQQIFRIQHKGTTIPQSRAEKWSRVSSVKGHHGVVWGTVSTESVTRSHWCSETVITDRCSTEE